MFLELQSHGHSDWPVTPSWRSGQTTFSTEFVWLLSSVMDCHPDVMIFDGL